MADHVTIRKLADADIEKTVQLWLDCDLTRPWNDPRADIAQALKSGCAEILVATDKAGRILGSVMVGDDGHRGWLYRLAVAPEHRGLGRGRALVRHAETWLREHGLRKVQLMIRPEHGEARDFYLQVGYAVQDRLLMARWLDGRPLTP